MEPNKHDVPQLDEIEFLLVAGRALERAAARVVFADLVAGRPRRPDLVWSVCTSSGCAVLRNGRFQIEPQHEDAPPGHHVP
jgi:hypothetical protein